MSWITLNQVDEHAPKIELNLDQKHFSITGYSLLGDIQTYYLPLIEILEDISRLPNHKLQLKLSSITLV